MLEFIFLDELMVAHELLLAYETWVGVAVVIYVDKLGYACKNFKYIVVFM